MTHPRVESDPLTDREYLFAMRRERDEGYAPRAPRPTKLDPHKECLRDRLEGAGLVLLAATVLLRDIRAQGHAGGITQLKEFLI